MPDSRLNKLAELVNPERIMPTTIEIVDIAGLVKGASKGEGLGNQFLGNIRECDAIIHVLRCFEDGNIVHVDGSVDPIRDKEVIDFELQLKDLDTLQKRIDKVKKQAQVGDKDAKKLFDIYEKYRVHLEMGKSARSADIDEKERELVSDLWLLTDKPVMYVCNVDETSVVNGNEMVDKVKAAVADEDAEVIVLGVGIEADIASLDTYDERQMFLEDLGLDEPGVSKLIRSAYKLLDLQTYFTAGEKEVRAWTIPVGAKAPQAAGVIHTDFEKGFIRAEVIGYDDYITHKSESSARDAGKLHIEGKEYIVKDGDVMHFRFNV